MLEQKAVMQQAVSGAISYQTAESFFIARRTVLSVANQAQ
jgi:DNA-binding CsgD family transcriptional regulator